MTEVVTIGVFGACTMVIGWASWKYRQRRRQSGALSGMLSVADNVFHPEAARAVEIREIQKQLPETIPAPSGKRTETCSNASSSARSRVSDV